MHDDDIRLSVYLDHRSALIAYAVRLSGSREIAEDVVQDTYFKFVPSATHGAVGHPVAYLHRIVRNQVLDVLRRRNTERRLLGEDTPEWETLAGSQATPEQAMLVRDQLKRAASALSQLPQDIRLAFEMYRLDGCSLAEVADVLGVSIATAHRLIRRATVEVAKSIDRDET